MKYRIRKSPQIDQEPLFFIQAWGHKVNESIWSNKNIECWCSVTDRGYPIHQGYGSSLYEDYLGSFKSLEDAKEYLNKIIEYHKTEIKTVFEIES